jgi:glucose dehydrogenase
MYFTGTANAYEWNPKNRGGGKLDNLGAASIVAVNTTNGKVAWRYVGVPGDPFDYDIPQTPMVISMDGKKTIVQPNKTGYVHYLDAATGNFIKATPFADKINWAKGYDSNGRPIDMMPPPKEGGEAIELYPSLLGGVNMYPNAYNPKTGKEVWRNEEKKPGYAGGILTSAGNVVFYATQGGEFRAVNATTGQVLYSKEFGTGAKAGPMTFQHGGKQYVVQALGGQPGFGRDEAWNVEFGSLLVAFSR